MQRCLLKAVLAVLATIAIAFPTRTVLACVGDCNNDNMVTINEILVMVNVALGSGHSADCMAGDRNGDQMITVDEILAAVGSALNGCGGVGGTPTPTPLPGCHANADCVNPTYPYCGPDGSCWTPPCVDVCSGGQSCCGGDYPYCGPDGSCWSAPCSTLCGETCCGPTQQCQNDASCTAGAPTPTPVAGCHANADCINPTYPYCGPDGNCWTQPCADVCSGGQSCCGGNYPYCGPDGSCWSAPCSTLCGETCCGPTQQCQNNTSCTAGAPTPTPVAGCHVNADCINPTYPYCGPHGNCWTQPCSDVCSDGQSCCGRDYPYCGPDDSCWNAPCSTLCGSTCCGPTQTCQNDMSCSH